MLKINLNSFVSFKIHQKTEITDFDVLAPSLQIFEAVQDAEAIFHGEVNDKCSTARPYVGKQVASSFGMQPE